MSTQAPHFELVISEKVSRFQNVCRDEKMCWLWLWNFTHNTTFIDSEGPHIAISLVCLLTNLSEALWILFVKILHKIVLQWNQQLSSTSSPFFRLLTPCCDARVAAYKICQSKNWRRLSSWFHFHINFPGMSDGANTFWPYQRTNLDKSLNMSAPILIFDSDMAISKIWVSMWRVMIYNRCHTQQVFSCSHILVWKVWNQEHVNQRFGAFLQNTS